MKKHKYRYKGTNKPFILKNYILKGITGAMFTLFLCSVSALDSELYKVPLTLAGISGAWLILFGIANGVIE